MIPASLLTMKRGLHIYLSDGECLSGLGINIRKTILVITNEGTCDRLRELTVDNDFMCLGLSISDQETVRRGKETYYP